MDRVCIPGARGEQKVSHPLRGRVAVSRVLTGKRVYGSLKHSPNPAHRQARGMLAESGYGERAEPGLCPSQMPCPGQLGWFQRFLICSGEGPGKLLLSHRPGTTSAGKDPAGGRYPPPRDQARTNTCTELTRVSVGQFVPPLVFPAGAGAASAEELAPQPSSFAEATTVPGQASREKGCRSNT